ncbi:MAG: polysaccharide biosynthesis protein [Thermoleophilia bacterium]|nr:polysaccharide biosynthesis protein [Thermoleophilia bacterium]
MSAPSRRATLPRAALEWASRRVGGSAVSDELSATVVAGASGTALIQGGILLLTTVSTVVLTRILGPSGYGAYAYALTWALLLASPALLAMPPLLVRKIAEYETRREWGLMRGIIRRFNAVSLTSAFVVAGLGAVAGWLLIGDDTRLFRPFLVGLLLVPLIAFASLRAAAMQGLGRVVRGRIPEPLHLLLFVPAIVVAYVALGHRFDATWAVAAFVATAALVQPLGVVLLRRSLPREAKEASPEYEDRSWARSAAPLATLSVIAPLSSELGIVMLGAIKGADAVGIFSVASRAALFVSFLFGASMYSLLPVLARLYAAHDHESLQRVLTRSARVLSVLTIPLAAGLILFAGPVLSIFGPGFEGGVTPLRILAVAYFVNVVGGFSGATLLMTGNEKALMKGTAVTAVLFIAVSAALIPLYGPTGAAVATAVQIVATNVLFSLLLWKHERLLAPAVIPRGLGGG